MKLYECPQHDQAFEENAVNCDCCRRITAILKAREARGPIPRTPHLPASVYWPTRMGHMGRTIEHLEHRPIHFDSKQKYRDYLKRSNVREAG